MFEREEEDISHTLDKKVKKIKSWFILGNSLKFRNFETIKRKNQTLYWK